jgi:hypothetical protein
MLSTSNRWVVWFLLCVAALVGAITSFLDFWAAVDLAYDSSSRGRSIVFWWVYALLGLSVGTIIFGVMAVRCCLYAKRKNSDVRVCK